MLLLGFVLQPVMATYGQFHETLAHFDDGAAHVEGHVEGDAHETGIASPAGGAPHEPGFLHALSHHAHCCAQPQWLPPAGMPVPPLALSGARPPNVDPDASPGARIDTPFRPPIVA